MRAERSEKENEKQKLTRELREQGPRRQARVPSAIEVRVSTIKLSERDIWSVRAGKGCKLFVDTEAVLVLYSLKGHSTEAGVA